MKYEMKEIWNSEQVEIIFWKERWNNIMEGTKRQMKKGEKWKKKEKWKSSTMIEDIKIWYQLVEI